MQKDLLPSGLWCGWQDSKNVQMSCFVNILKDLNHVSVHQQKHMNAFDYQPQ